MNKRTMSIFIFTCLGSLIAIVTGFIQYQDKIKSDKEAEASKLEAKQANHQLNQLLIDQKDSIQRVVDLQNELLTANEQIKDLQSELLGNVTGNGNKPLLMVVPASKSDSIVSLGVLLQNTKNTPLRGLQVVINGSGVLDQMALLNPDSWKQSLPKHLQDIANGSQIKIDVGDIAKGGIKDVTQLMIMDTVKSFEYRITVNWDNGSYYCVIKGTNMPGKVFPSLEIDQVIENHKLITNHPFILAVNSNQ